MAKRMRVMALAGAACALLFLVACGAANAPAAPSLQPVVGSGGLLVGDPVVTAAASGLPDWILNPATLPPGRVGKNNCTFAFGQDVPQWDFHADAGCWERPGPDGWTRNQQSRVHIPSFRACGGGPGDAEVIRVCRVGGAGQPNPCTLDPLTGPAGCARCVINPTCH